MSRLFHMRIRYLRLSGFVISLILEKCSLIISSYNEDSLSHKESTEFHAKEMIYE